MHVYPLWHIMKKNGIVLHMAFLYKGMSRKCLTETFVLIDMTGLMPNSGAAGTHIQ